MGVISQVGLIAALAALVGASCCALPLALASLGLAGAWIASLEVFAAYRPYVSAVAVLLVALGWIVARRRRASPRAHVLLGVATAVIVAALVLPHFEAALIREFAAPRGKG
jgi:mercuric ion transport protein